MQRMLRGRGAPRHRPDGPGALPQIPPPPRSWPRPSRAEMGRSISGTGLPSTAPSRWGARVHRDGDVIGPHRQEGEGHDAGEDRREPPRAPPQADEGEPQCRDLGRGDPNYPADHRLPQPSSRTPLGDVLPGHVARARRDDGPASRFSSRSRRCLVFATRTTRRSGDRGGAVATLPVSATPGGVRDDGAGLGGPDAVLPWEAFPNDGAR